MKPTDRHRRRHRPWSTYLRITTPSERSPNPCKPSSFAASGHTVQQRLETRPAIRLDPSKHGVRILWVVTKSPHGQATMIARRHIYPPHSYRAESRHKDINQTETFIHGNVRPSPSVNARSTILHESHPKRCHVKRPQLRYVWLHLHYGSRKPASPPASPPFPNSRPFSMAGWGPSGGSRLACRGPCRRCCPCRRQSASCGGLRASSSW